jgi:hypothetical protein
MRTHRSEKTFASGLRGGILTTSIPAPASAVANASMN